MLVLTRKIGETIRMQDSISVTVLGVRGSQVKLGVQAPDGVAIHRDEVYLRIQAENQCRARARKTTMHPVIGKAKNNE